MRGVRNRLAGYALCLRKVRVCASGRPHGDAERLHVWREHGGDWPTTCSVRGRTHIPSSFAVAVKAALFDPKNV